jgi:hypothetical protein
MLGSEVLQERRVATLRFAVPVTSSLNSYQEATVLSKPLHAALLAGTLSLINLVGGAPAPASAAVASSQITAPAGPAYTLFDETLLPNVPAVTVSGTTSGSGSVALRCYYGIGPNEYEKVVEEVTPDGGSFSVGVDAHALDVRPCVLRAVPVSDTKAHPPGSPAEEASDPFKGPVIAGSRFEVEADDEVDDYYEFEAASSPGYLDIEAAGACGLVSSTLYAQGSLLASANLFGCNAAFFEANEPPSGKSTRSDLQVDGANAYTPTTARFLEEDLKVTIPGVPRLSVTQTFDAATGLVSIRELDPIVKCSPEALFPPTSTSCKQFVATGVQLERTWQTSSAGEVAMMTDSWSSTDGNPHTLNALYEQWFAFDESEGGTFLFPGAGAFAPAKRGDAVTLPASGGASAIDYKEDAATPAAGDGEHPQGAVVYSRTPSEPLTVHEGSDESKPTGTGTGFSMPYEATVPATGAYTLQMGFVQAYGLAEVQALTQVVESSFAVPQNTATPPAAPLAEAPSVTVADTASRISRIGAANGRVTFTLACSGAAGTSCEVRSSLTTIEKLRGGRPVAVAARTRDGKTKPGTEAHPRRISVGSSRLTIPAGQRIAIAIALNATGRRLLAKFGRLPVHLNVILVNAGQRSAIIARNLTVEPRHKARKRHRHHRRRR